MAGGDSLTAALLVSSAVLNRITVLLEVAYFILGFLMVINIFMILGSFRPTIVLHVQSRIKEAQRFNISATYPTRLKPQALLCLSRVLWRELRHMLLKLLGMTLM